MTQELSFLLSWSRMLGKLLDNMHFLCTCSFCYVHFSWGCMNTLEQFQATITCWRTLFISSLQQHFVFWSLGHWCRDLSYAVYWFTGTDRKNYKHSRRNAAWRHNMGPKSQIKSVWFGIMLPICKETCLYLFNLLVKLWKICPENKCRSIKRHTCDIVFAEHSQFIFLQAEDWKVFALWLFVTLASGMSLFMHISHHI